MPQKVMAFKPGTSIHLALASFAQPPVTKKKFNNVDMKIF